MNSFNITGRIKKEYKELLTHDAVNFLIQLHENFNGYRLRLLKERVVKQKELDSGTLPKFLPETKHIREDNWICNPTPLDLLDRRVEITGPVDRKMIINALNSGAKVFMADFEDSTSPTWTNIMDGQVNLKDATRKIITYTDPKTKKHYKLDTTKRLATLMVRPRGWHLNESHVLINNEPMSASLFDFGLYFFHNAKYLINNGSGPYFYLPKLESYLEARLWNDVFVYSQKTLGIKVGTIKATVLCETILAAFQQDEILYELREHSAGLNCGRWDYIFSYIKKFKTYDKSLLPNRSQVGMTSPWMDAYAKLLIKTCHRRGVHAMGGMAAQIPVKNNPQKNNEALEKIRQDKEREVLNGHDGSWVAHPGLIKVAMNVYDKHMKTPNQINKSNSKEQNVVITQKDLLNLGPMGQITMEGVRANISAGVRYLAAWLNGNGCVPLNHKMEDAATAEISRCQLWQWLRFKAVTHDTSELVTKELLKKELEREYNTILKECGNCNNKFTSLKYELSFKLFEQMIFNNELDEFMTSVAYPYIIENIVKANL